jgi:hypothetical protein
LVRILNCDSGGSPTRRNAPLLQQFRGQWLDENASGQAPDSPQKNDDHVVATALRRGSPREKDDAASIQQTKDFDRGDFARA